MVGTAARHCAIGPLTRGDEIIVPQCFGDTVARMDAEIGHIVERAEKLGIAEETLILVTGDRGRRTY